LEPATPKTKHTVTTPIQKDKERGRERERLSLENNLLGYQVKKQGLS
jgi:hypothetical protein